eukprot:TRINITY_DN54597_c0_g1_i1.p1 TRINITY_DN54597_c0_g1~~TRINITY_DN54597_c0_g1_i1.p1  ORF type:complete len:1041 (+),score=128.38 TRINITY_DN54597_c0_g1_i1:63-3185(+)
MAVDPSLLSYFDQLSTTAGATAAPPAEREYMVNAAAQELGVVLRTMREKVVRGEPFSKADIHRWLNDEKAQQQANGGQNPPLTNATKLLLLSSLSDSFSQLSAADMDMIARMQVIPPEMQQALGAAPPQHPPTASGPQPYKRKKPGAKGSNSRKIRYGPPPLPLSNSQKGKKANPRNQKFAKSQFPHAMGGVAPYQPGYVPMAPPGKPRDPYEAGGRGQTPDGNGIPFNLPPGTALVTDPATGQPTLVPLANMGVGGPMMMAPPPDVMQPQALGSAQVGGYGFNPYQRGVLPPLPNGPTDVQRMMTAVQIEEETRRATLLQHEYRERQALFMQHKQAEAPLLQRHRIMNDPHRLAQQSRITVHEQEGILQEEYNNREQLLEQEHQERIAIWNKMMDAAEYSLHEMSAITIQSLWRGYQARKDVAERRRVRGLQNAWEVELMETANRRQVEQQLQIEFAAIVELFLERRDLQLLQMAEKKGRAAIQEEAMWRFMKISGLSTDDRLASTVLMVLHDELHSRRAMEILEDKLYRQWREDEYRARIEVQKLQWDNMQKRTILSTVKIQNAWRSYTSRLRFYALMRARERRREMLEDDELNRFFLGELEEHETAARRALEWEEEETFKDWAAVHAHHWRRALEEFNARLDAENAAERDAICQQLDMWERMGILEREVKLRQMLYEQEEDERINILHARETNFLCTQMNLHEQKGISDAEFEERWEIIQAEDDEWRLLLSEEWSGVVLAVDDHVRIVERERRHRADILRQEAAEREALLRMRWADFSSILRVPNEKATIIQCAWRSYVARARVRYMRAWRGYQGQVAAVCQRLADMEDDYRRRLEDEEILEHNYLVEQEEEDWTRVHVRVIERAYMAYKTRQVINEEVRRHQMGLLTLQEELFYAPHGQMGMQQPPPAPPHRHQPAYQQPHPQPSGSGAPYHQQGPPSNAISHPSNPYSYPPQYQLPGGGGYPQQGGPQSQQPAMEYGPRPPYAPRAPQGQPSPRVSVYANFPKGQTPPPPPGFQYYPQPPQQMYGADPYYGPHAA